MKKEKYTCPICGYNELEFYPDESYEQCPCCGYMFGTLEYLGEDLSDNINCELETKKVYAYVRDKWIANGANWWSESVKAPVCWDYKKQLNNLKSKKRLFEEKVIKFFVSKIPEINGFVNDIYYSYDITEEAGMYIVLPDIIRYLTSCVKKCDYVKVEEFFNAYNIFYEEFADEYHEIVPSDTMYNLNAVELFEIIDTYEKKERKKVISLMGKKLQKDYKKCCKNI